MKVAIRDAGVEGAFIYLIPGVGINQKINPVAATTPRGLPARGPQSPPGTDFIIALARPDSGRLTWCQNNVAEAFINKCPHYSIVTRGFRQPHTFRFAPKSITKIRQSPANLRAQIMVVAERQDRMPESLGDRVAMAAVLQNTFTIS